MLVLTFITFSIFTPALTGYFVAGEAEWENRLLETVMSSTDTITVTIEFGEYKPDKCSEGVYVETQYGDKIEFMVIEVLFLLIM